MKHLTQLFGMVLLVTLAAGCTHNNGDIGSWFGTWNVERIEIDGVAQADYQGQYFFQFQSTVFCVRKVDEQRTDYLEDYGRWSEDGDVLTIAFPDASVAYVDFSALLDADNRFTMVERGNRSVVLTRTDGKGRLQRLTLKKIVP